MQEASARYFGRSLVDGYYCGWMAETAQGRVVAGGGVAIVHWPGSPAFPETRRGWILNIYTEPEHRHRGVAKRIMRTTTDWCRAEGFVYVSLHSSQFGRRLYEQLGFQPTNEMRLYLRCSFTAPTSPRAEPLASTPSPSCVRSSRVPPP